MKRKYTSFGQLWWGPAGPKPDMSNTRSGIVDGYHRLMWRSSYPVLPGVMAILAYHYLTRLAK